MKLKLELNVNQVINELFEDNAQIGDYGGIELPELDIKDAIKDEIVSSLKKEVVNMYGEKFRKKFVEDSKEIVEEAVNERIQQTIDEMIEAPYLNLFFRDEPMTLKQWVKNKFEEKNKRYGDSLKQSLEKEITNMSMKLNDEVKNQVNELQQEIKNRYDLLFASQLIGKLNEGNMLKEGVFESLMKMK